MVCASCRVMLTLHDLKELSNVGGPCLTILEPLRDPTGRISVAETRLKGAAQTADSLLSARGYEAVVRESFLRPVHKLAENTEWEARAGSIVILRAPDFTKAIFWPSVLEPRVELGDEFLVLPLMAELRKRDFWLVALSARHIRLFRGDRDCLIEVTLPAGVPVSVADAGEFDVPDHNLEGRSSPGASSGQTAPIRFGTSSEREKKWAHLHDFFRRFDRAIHPILRDSGHPLILAGVIREDVIYRDVNTYKGLLPGSISCSPGTLTNKELHLRALDLLGESMRQTGARLAEEADAARSAGLLLTNIAAIRAAARRGQIDRLLIEDGPGRLPPEVESTVNTALLHVLRHAGEVVSCELSLPEGVAAVLRWPAVETSEPPAAPKGGLRQRASSEGTV